MLRSVSLSPKNAPACNLSYVVARRFGKFRVIINIADNRKAVAVGAQVIQKLHGVNGKNAVGSYSEAFMFLISRQPLVKTRNSTIISPGSKKPIGPLVKVASAMPIYMP